MDPLVSISAPGTAADDASTKVQCSGSVAMLVAKASETNEPVAITPRSHDSRPICPATESARLSRRIDVGGSVITVASPSASAAWASESIEATGSTPRAFGGSMETLWVASATEREASAASDSVATLDAC